MSAFRNYFGTQLMKVMFIPVFGWKAELPAEMRPVVVNGVDGSSLEAGLLKTSHEKPRGVIMLSHPFVKYGMHYFIKKGLHSVLSEAGYHVVLFNFKGFGNSKVNGPSFFDDTKSVHSWVLSEFPDLAIHFLGWSFGGYHSVHSLAKYEMEFSSITLDSVPFSIGRYFSQGLMAKGMRILESRPKMARVTGVEEIETSLSKITNQQILYLYGGSDKFITEQDLKDFRVNLPSNIELTVFGKCGHNELYEHDKERYLELVLAFMDKCSKKRGMQ